jgi:hypothetical protein
MAPRSKAPAPVQGDDVLMVVLRDYWDADAVRIASGTVISVPINDAMAGLETGALRRATDDDL